jgi:predicted TIM-barrel fold metal-dependent hydrolase
VQPSNHQYDHRYLNSVLQQYPDRFVGCLLADPTPGGGGAAAIEQLAQQHGYRAVRFNPYLWPEGEKMTNEVRRVDCWLPSVDSVDAACDVTQIVGC